MDPQLRRAEVFRCPAAPVAAGRRGAPQVVVFEDCTGWIQATEAFLTMTVDSIPTGRVLCLLTYRPGYVHPFGERTYHTRLVLPTLSSADTVQMAQAMLATEHLPRRSRRSSSRRPKAIPSLSRKWSSPCARRGPCGGRVRYVLARPLDETVVPTPSRTCSMARIDRLTEAQEDLQLAAVIGREFTRRLLDRLADIRERTEPYLQELKALELIYEKRLFPSWPTCSSTP